MRVLVCGGRFYENSDLIHQELIRLHWQNSIDVIIHGGVAGAGAAAEAWARRNRVDVVRYPPNWEGWGKKAESLRNNFMLADGRPDVVIAFPGGRDTADLVQKAITAGIQVLHAPSATGKERMEAEVPLSEEAPSAHPT
ncbi:MAG TPA: SLOG family protein [Xanthobacteraceae bacterium]|nr:SLOG family protein [Xanthobacteraceae bacterium]